MALVFSEMDTDKRSARWVSSFSAELQPHFILRLKEKPRPPYAHQDFQQLWLHLPEVGGYFPVPGTLNQLLMALVFSKIDKVKGAHAGCRASRQNYSPISF